MHTRDQRYANQILEQVKAISNVPEGERKKYGTMAHKLPVLVRTAGLAQALAFVDARGSDAQKRLLDHIAEVVNLNGRETLLQESRSAELGAYMHLTHNVLAALIWYKRFAQSVLNVDAGDESGEEDEA